METGAPRRQAEGYERIPGAEPMSRRGTLAAARALRKLGALLGCGVFLAVGIGLYPGAVVCESSRRPLTVIVDPGHGGEDHGGRGFGGVVEKEVNLELAEKLVQILEERETVHPVLTRRDDRVLSLDDRAGLANHSGGELFISLHTGNAFRPVPLGFFLYYWSPVRTVSAAPSASAPASSWEEGQKPYWEQSRRFAEAIQEELIRTLPWPSGGILAADLYLLKRVRMPAVLVELGSLVHPGEAAELQEPAFQERIARALAAAVCAYGTAQTREKTVGEPRAQ
jgi:N-acetylmuramoyl-L-alanine amidase